MISQTKSKINNEGKLDKILNSQTNCKGYWAFKGGVVWI